MFVKHQVLLPPDLLTRCEYVDADKLWENSNQLAFADHPRMSDKTQANRNIGVYSDDLDLAPGYYPSKSSDFFIAARPLTQHLNKFLTAVNQEFKEAFNLLIVNEYMNNRDSIGAHYDTVETLGVHCVITLSMGSTRTFRVQSREYVTEPPKDFLMQHGQVIRMSNRFQMLFTHEVPSETCPSKRRVSITCRKVCHPKPVLKSLRHDTPCIVCKEPNRKSSNVCDECYAKNLFKCPQCDAPVGAPWPCTACWTKSQNK